MSNNGTATKARPGFGAYQNEIYGKGMFQNIRSTVTTDPNKLEAQAKEAMRIEAFGYVAGGAGERATMEANRLAFRQWKLIPRMLRQRTTQDLQVQIFGETYETPLLTAPVGVLGVFHRDGELGVAEVAGELGVTYVTSTASTQTIEAIAAANELKNKDAKRWFQLYWPKSKALTESMLTRAKAAGYKVLVVTLDTWTLAWRPTDLDQGYIPFVQGIGNAIGFSDPVFQQEFAAEHNGAKVEDNIPAASAAWLRQAFSNPPHTWEDLTHIRATWDGPIVLKGIQHPADAVRAIDEYEMDGVVVSNHGGRQLDGAVGSLEMLPDIVAALHGKKCVRTGLPPEVLFDSGIRTGVDIVKALCLGAKAVLVGRPWVYGLGIAGKAGAKEVLQGLLADFDQSLGLAGILNVGDCTRDKLRKSAYPGDRHSSD